MGGTHREVSEEEIPGLIQITQITLLSRLEIIGAEKARI